MFAYGINRAYFKASDSLIIASTFIRVHLESSVLPTFESSLQLVRSITNLFVPVDEQSLLNILIVNKLKRLVLSDLPHFRVTNSSGSTKIMVTQDSPKEGCHYSNDVQIKSVEISTFGWRTSWMTACVKQKINTARTNLASNLEVTFVLTVRMSVFMTVLVDVIKLHSPGKHKTYCPN